MDATPSQDLLNRLAAEFAGSHDAARVIRKRTAAVDELVCAAGPSLIKDCEGRRVTLAACGGYGREELFPYSDVDLLILVEKEADARLLKDPLAPFLQSLWDQGLRISHSVRTVSECAQLNEQNIELHISLLDLRYLAGDTELFEDAQARLRDFLHRHAHTLMRRLAEMSRARHSKYNDTVFHLEPNIKETPGGLRDWHLLHWLSRLMPQNESIREAEAGLSAAVKFLSELRCFLHFRTKRDNNLLSFELQDEASQAFGGLEPAEWMRRYFRCARQISHAALRALEYTETQDTSLARQFRDWRSRLSTNEFTVSRERIFLRRPAETVASPEALLRLFIFVARHGIRISWDAQRKLSSEAGEIAARVRASPVRWQLIKELFEQPNVALALREMEETSVLSAIFPEWSAVDSLVVRDFYHRYTVDEHTFVAISIIDDLAASKPSTPHRFRDLFRESGSPWLLRFALLLHDIGKGITPGEHIHGSIETAGPVMDRLGVPAEYQETILFLIQHHLDLSSIMSGRDLDDPATGRQLTRQLGTLERLRWLTLLTFADISAVNPTAMTPWRLEQLWRVYLAGAEQLTRDLEIDRIHNVEDPNHTLFRERVTPELREFLEGLPTRYLRTHLEADIRHQIELVRNVKTAGAAVEIRRQVDAWQALVLAKDQPGLFSKICGALASAGMNIVKAEAASNVDGVVVDEFRFADPLRALELNPTEVDQLRLTLERVVRGSVQVEELLRRRRTPTRPSRGSRIQPVVRFNQQASDSSTLIDFVGEDRPGLLYDLTAAMSQAGCNIEVVMIDTEAHKALDVFYVTKQGDKLTESDEDELRVALLEAAVRT